MRKRTLDRLIRKLEAHRLIFEDSPAQYPRHELDFFNIDRTGTYQAVMYVPQDDNHIPMLQRLKRDDIVCDVGAGDLRFALMASQICKKVYAVEMNPKTLGDALNIIEYHMPRNLIPVCADWRHFPIPDETTVITCMVNGIGGYDIPTEWKTNGRKIFYGWVGPDDQSNISSVDLYVR